VYAPAEQALIDKINGGFVVESEEDMTPGYKKALIVQLTVQGDTELMSAPAYYLASRDAPNINSRIAVQKEAGTVCYVHGLLPVFRHEEADVRSFRMFTSQMIAGGTVKPKEIVKTFGVPMITVKRYLKLYRECGAKGFFEAKPRHSSASVLKGEVLEQAQRMLDEGRSMPEVAAELGVLRNTLLKAVRAGRLRGGQKKASARPAR